MLFNWADFCEVEGWLASQSCGTAMWCVNRSCNGKTNQFKEAPLITIIGGPYSISKPKKQIDLRAEPILATQKTLPIAIISNPRLLIQDGTRLFAIVFQ